MSTPPGIEARFFRVYQHEELGPVLVYVHQDEPSVCLVIEFQPEGHPHKALGFTKWTALDGELATVMQAFQLLTKEQVLEAAESIVEEGVEA